jgi:hypothetical protein
MGACTSLEKTDITTNGTARSRPMYASRISSAMLVRDSRTSSANGAFGRHERQDSAGMGPSAVVVVEAAQGIEAGDIQRPRRDCDRETVL